MKTLIFSLTIFAAIAFGSTQALAQITADQNPATVGTPVDFSITGNNGVFYWGVTAGSATPTSLSARSQTFTITPTAPGTLTVRAVCGSQIQPTTFYLSIGVNAPPPVSFTISPVSFTYNGSAQGPAITPSVPGASFSTSGTTSATAAGSYSVTATATGSYSSGSGSSAWTIAQATPSVLWTTPAPITYGTALGSTQLNATANVPGSFTYTPAAGAVLTAPSHTLSVVFTPTDTTDYSSASASVSLTVHKATPVVSWTTPAPITYGAALSSTQLNATANVPGSFVYTPAAGTVPATPSQALSVVFTPTDSTDYNSASTSVSLTVNKATPVVSWTAPAPITYGTALGSTQLNATANVPGSFVYTPAAGTMLAAGSQTLSVAFTPTDPIDYNSASVSVPLTVNAEPVTFTISPVSFTYNGGAQGPAITPSVAGATYSTSGTAAATTAGSYSVAATATGYYTGTSGSTAWTIAKATPVISWTIPPAINYGTALGSTQLNATANVPGSFVYTPAAGTVLAAGSQTLSVAFTPTDTTDYNSVSSSVPLTVNAQPVTFTISPVSFTYNGGAQGPAITPSVAGATYSASGTVSAAAAGSYSVTATATGNYTGSGSTAWTIAKVTPVISWTAPAPIGYGTALGSAQLNATANVPGSFAYTPSGGAILATGAQTLSVVFTPTDSADYNSISASVPLAVNKATPLVTNWASQPFANHTGYTVTANNLSAVFTSNPYSSSITQPTGTVTYSVASCNSGAVPAGTVVTAGTVLPPATYTIQASYPGDANYNAALANVTWIISDPVSLTQASLANSNVFTTNAISIAFGQTATVMGISSDQANLLVSQTIDYQLPGSSTWVSGSLAAGTAWSGGPTGGDTLTWTIPLSTLGSNFSPAGLPWHVRAWAANNVPFTSLNTTNIVSITYTQATPVVSNWASQVFNVSGNTYTVTAGNLDAEFINPYNSSVAPPTGAPIYSVVSCSSGAVPAGTVITPNSTLPLARYTICASYPGDANYNATTVNVTWTVMATPVVSWTTSAPITYGTVLGPTQLDATTNVPGTFVYTPAVGTVLAAGSQTLSVAFTPTDTTDYKSASASVSLTVNKATPVVSNWANQAFNVSGNTYTVVAGNLGAEFFNPYNNSAAPPTGAPVYSVVSCSSGAVAAGTVITPNATLPLGTYIICASYPGDANYNATTANVTWTLVATPVISWTAPAPIAYGTALGSIQLNATASVPGTFTYTPAAGTLLPLGFSTLSVVFTPTDTIDYNGTSASVSLTVNKGTPVISSWVNQMFTVSGNNSYAVTAGNLGAVFVNANNSSAVARPTGTVTYSVVSSNSGAVPTGTGLTPGYSLPPGAYTIRASYPGDPNYNSTTADVNWVIDNPVSATTASATTVEFGQPATITGTATDADGLLVSQSIAYLPPPGTTWVSSAATWSGGPTANDTLTWTIPASTFGNNFGLWQFLAWSSSSVPFTSLNGPIAALSINYTKATPAVSNWTNQTITFSGNNFTVAAANLGAVFSNPYSSSVAQPTGTVTYSVVDSGPIVAGATTLPPGTYTIQASYPGDANYEATTADVTWNVNSTTNPNGDSTGDGIPNSQKTANTYTKAINSVGMTVPGGWPLLAAADPNNPHAVGQTAGSLSVDKSGSATYTIPLFACPGTGGMEPSLSLNYSSAAGAGVAGFGWSLSGTSSITRGAQTRAIDGNGTDNFVRGMNFATTDRYYLDGQRLIAINGGADGADQTEYRTELDSFSRIMSYGTSGNGPAYFKVWTKSGKIMEYGNTPDSAFAPQAVGGTIMSWAVDKISDTVGNYMTFIYSIDTLGGEQHLAEIDYTGNTTANTQPYDSVQFVYSLRQDSNSGYVHGALLSNTKILQQINACTGIGSGATIVHSYVLDYTNRSYTNRSILADIKEYGADNKAYPQTNFTYSDPSPGWDVTQSYHSKWAPPVPLVASNGAPQGTQFIDLDGDGRPDFVQRHLGSYGNTVANEAWINDPMQGWVVADGSNAGVPDWRLPLPLADDSRWVTGLPSLVRLVDFDADGQPDIIDGLSGSAYVNTGSGWALSNEWTLPGPNPNNNSGTFVRKDIEFIDLNGDGLPDCICWTVNGSTVEPDAWINLGPNQIDPTTGTHWQYAPQFAMPFYDLAGGSIFIDLNGDGLPDEVQYSLSSSSGGPAVIGVALNTGKGWNILPVGSDDFNRFAPPCPLSGCWPNGTPGSLGVQEVDLNGDGLPDLISYDYGKVGADATYLNTGYGWVPAASYPAMFQLWDSGLPQSGNMGTTILDIEGDGQPAFLCCLNNGASGTINNAVWLNTGSGWSVQTTGDYFIPWPTADLATTNHSTGADFEDLNGNGGLDELWNGPDENGFNHRGAGINNRVNIDRLIKVTNGMQVSASVTYKPLTDRDPTTGKFTVYTKGTGAVWPKTDLIAPMYVVSEVDTDDGTGGQYTMTYHYTGLRSDALHGDLGFASTTATDSRTLASTVTNYVQDYPFIGLVKSTATTQANGAVLTANETTWADIPTNYTSNSGVTLMTHFPYASQVLQQSYDSNGAFLSSSSTTAANYDNYGNAGTVDVQSLNVPSNPNNYSDPNSYGSSTGYEKKTINTYANIVAPAPGNWFLGRLSSLQTISSAPATSPITHIANFVYDGVSGLLVQEIPEPGDPLSLTTSYHYDSFGNITTATTAATNSGTGLAPRSITTIYDALGQFPVSTTNALGQKESYVYDSRWGVMTSETGPNGLTTAWSYDGMGRKIAETRAAGTATPTFTTINYRWASSNSVLTSINAPAGPTYLIETETSGASPSLIFFDNMGRAIYAFGLNGGDFDGNPRIVGKETQYDAMGRAYWTSLPFYYLDAPSEASSVTSYDALNRPLEVQTADEEAPGGFVDSTFVYNGLVTTDTSPSGQATVTTKNAEGQVLSVVTNATGNAATDIGKTDYTYDADGNVLSTNVANSNSPGTSVSTYYTYDLIGRKVTMTDPDRGTWSYTYDPEGELTSQTDANKHTVTMAYDVLGRLVTRTEPEGTTTWTYDTAANGIGELASISAPNNYTESYTYDSLGRPITTVRKINTGTPAVPNIEEFDMGQQYDAFSRPTIGTYPGGYQVQNNYNAFGFLQQVTQASANTNFGHDTVQGQVFWQADSYSIWGGVNGSTYGNGVTEDAIVAATTGRVLGFGIGVNEEVAFYGYTHDVLGNITNRNDEVTGRNETYTYDGLNRLTASTLSTNGSPLSTVNVAYDSLGNITSKSDVGAYTYGQHGAGPHAVTAAGGKSYLYDANGNMTSSSVLVNGMSTADRNFKWTSFNQASHIDQNGHSSDFTFDADHQRVTQTTEQGVNTVYVGSAFERVTSSSGTDLKYYIFTPAGRSVVRTVHASSGTVATRYLHQDVLGSIVAVTDETGAVAERYAYDPWGKQAALLTLSSGLQATTRGFTDHEMLPDLGLIHMNGRVYDPVLGRFLSADSVIQDLGDSQAYNRFSYCSNNPVNSIDPSGHSWFSRALKFLRKATRDLLNGPIPELNPLSGYNNRLYAWGESHQQELEIAAIIIVSIYTAGLASECLYTPAVGTAGTAGFVPAGGLLSSGTLASYPMLCTGLAGAAGGAAGGFVSGAGMESMNGGSISQDLNAGLKGAEYGAITGAITAGMGDLNGKGDFLEVKQFASPFADGGLATDGRDLLNIAGQGLEGAVKNELLNQNASAGFWSGAIAAVGGAYKVGNDPTKWGSTTQLVIDDLATGVLGGLKAMNKEQKGFAPGFWNAAAGAVGNELVTHYNPGPNSNPWLAAVYGTAENVLTGGLKSKLGGMAFDSGMHTTLYTSLASGAIDGIASTFGDKSSSAGPVGKGYALVQPKTDKKGKITIPLSKVNGGTWANGAAWAQLH